MHPIFNLISSAVVSALGLCFLLLKTPKSPSLGSYRIARRIMAFSYFILAGSNVLSLIMDGDLSDKRSEAYGMIIVAAFQAFLFTYACITLINMRFVKTKLVICEMLPICGLSLSLIVFAVRGPSSIEKACYYLLNIYYLSLLIRYTWLFFRQERLYKEKADNYFSDLEAKKLSWVRIAYLGALGVGIMAFFTQFSNDTYNLVFTGTYVLYYLYFAIRFINYAHTFHVVEPVVSNIEPVAGREPDADCDNGLAANLAKWIEGKKFLEPEITINELALQVNTNRTYLSNHINSILGMNFKTWISRLRIDEAKAIMLCCPDKSMNEVADSVGYRDQSTFNRQFVKLEKVSPVAWKKLNGNA